MWTLWEVNKKSHTLFKEFWWPQLSRQNRRTCSIQNHQFSTLATLIWSIPKIRSLAKTSKLLCSSTCSRERTDDYGRLDRPHDVYSRAIHASSQIDSLLNLLSNILAHTSTWHLPSTCCLWCCYWWLMMYPRLRLCPPLICASKTKVASSHCWIGWLNLPSHRSSLDQDFFSWSTFFTRGHWNYRLPQNLRNLANLLSKLSQPNFKFIF
jgi:hypothetical protein